LSNSRKRTVAILSALFLIVWISCFITLLVQQVSSRSENQKLEDNVRNLKIENDNLKEERSAAGLNPLKLNLLLVESATLKVQDMRKKNYWAHNTPDGQEPWIFFNQAGYSYYRAGENLAKDYRTGWFVIEGWMNSPSHKENILNPNYTEVGFGRDVIYSVNSADSTNLLVAHYGSPY